MSDKKIVFDCFPGDFDTLLRKVISLPPTNEGKEGLIILLRGSAGTGKTTLALQLAFHLSCIQQANEIYKSGIYYSLEQNTEALIDKLSGMLVYQIKHLCEMKEYDFSLYTQKSPVPLRKYCHDLNNNISKKMNDTKDKEKELFLIQESKKRTQKSKNKIKNLKKEIRILKKEINKAELDGKKEFKEFFECSSKGVKIENAKHEIAAVSSLYFSTLVQDKSLKS